jgi:hypothetical protein
MSVPTSARVGPLIDLARLPRVSAYLRQQALASEDAASRDRRITVPLVHLRLDVAVGLADVLDAVVTNYTTRP